MNDQPQFALVPVADLQALQQEVASLRQDLKGATITPAPEWVSIAKAAAHFDVDRSTIHRWIDAGRIEAKGAGKMRRVKIT